MRDMGWLITEEAHNMNLSDIRFPRQLEADNTLGGGAVQFSC